MKIIPWNQFAYQFCRLMSVTATSELTRASLSKDDDFCEGINDANDKDEREKSWKSLFQSSKTTIFSCIFHTSHIRISNSSFFKQFVWSYLKYKSKSLLPTLFSRHPPTKHFTHFIFTQKQVLTNEMYSYFTSLPSNHSNLSTYIHILKTKKIS